MSSSLKLYHSRFHLQLLAPRFQNKDKYPLLTSLSETQVSKTHVRQDGVLPYCSVLITLALINRLFWWSFGVLAVSRRIQAIFFKCGECCNTDKEKHAQEELRRGPWQSHGEGMERGVGRWCLKIWTIWWGRKGENRMEVSWESEGCFRNKEW